MKRRYDLIVALGGGGSVAEALWLSGLQCLSLPLDHAKGMSLGERADFVCGKDLDAIAATLAEMSGRDCATVMRRLNRLNRLIGTCKHVLLVWADIPGKDVATDADCLAAVDTFRVRWPEVEFDFVAFHETVGARLGDYDIREDGHLRTVAFDYRDKRGGHTDGDPRLLGGWLKKEYSVGDYRTQEDKDAWEKRQRERVDDTLRAMTSVERLATKIEMSVFRALERHLKRIGVVDA